MDCYFRQKWSDNRLRYTGPISPISLHIKMLEKLWKPDTFFHNGKGSHIHTITQPNKLLRIYSDGQVLYSVRYFYLTAQNCECPRFNKSHLHFNCFFLQINDKGKMQDGSAQLSDGQAVMPTGFRQLYTIFS